MPPFGASSMMPAHIAVVGVKSLLNRVNQDALPRAASSQLSLSLSEALTMTAAGSTLIPNSVRWKKSLGTFIRQPPPISQAGS